MVTDGDAKQIMQALGQLSNSVVQQSQEYVTLTALTVESATAFRAWEAILYLLCARYYAGKPDPIAATAADRDYLLDSFRKNSPDDEAMGRIEKIYQYIFDIIKNDRLAAPDHRDEDDAPLM